MPWLMVTRSDISQLPRSDPFGRDDVLRSPLSLRNVEDLLAERGVRVRIIDLIVEPLGMDTMWWFCRAPGAGG
jgi:hypothetical protein